MKEPFKPKGQNFWKEHFESWKTSGLTQQAYCTRERISYQSFVYQHNRANSKFKKSPIKFIEAKIKSTVEQNGSSGIQVMLSNGVRIVFGGEVTAGLIQEIFSIAGSITC